MDDQNITVNPIAQHEIRNRLEKILDLIALEHMHATTHSQRNAYQAVIRHEIEVLRDQIHGKGSGDSDNDIPF